MGRFRGIMTWAWTLLLVAPAAVASPLGIPEVNPGADSVAGTIEAPGDVDRIPFRLVEGALYSVSLKAARGSSLRPELRMLGADRRADPVANALVVVSAKGNAALLKNAAATGTGLHYVEIRGADGTTGGWTLTMKTKFPRSATVAGTLPGGTTPGEARFVVPGNATATVTASAAAGSGALPAFSALVGPAGETVTVGQNVLTPRGFVLKELYLAKPGAYRLRLTSPTEGAYTVLARWKVPRPARRALADTDVVTAPVATAFSPSAGKQYEVVDAVLTADFLKPGAALTFRKSPTVVTLSGKAVDIRETEAVLRLDLGMFSKGVYDLAVVNPDGGSALLGKALTVDPSGPRVTGVAPDHGMDDEVLNLQVAGDFLSPSAGVSLELGADRIDGTGVVGALGYLWADFDLRGRTPGWWDVVVRNPGEPELRQQGRFEIRTLRPPEVPETEAVRVVTASGQVDGPVSVAHGATRNEYGLAWLDRGTGTWDVYLQRVSAAGSPLGAPARVSTGGSPWRKQGPFVGWDPVHDEFLVVWIEHRTNPAFGGTGWTGGYSELKHVFAQRFQASDLAPLGGNVQIADNSSIPNGGLANGNNSLRPSATWDAGAGVWLVTWMHEWCTTTSTNPDDYFVASRTLDPVSGTMGAPVISVGAGYVHEGDPVNGWDPVGGRAILAFHLRSSLVGRFDLRVKEKIMDRNAASTVVATETSADLGDPVLEFDGKNSSMLVGWTRQPLSGPASVGARGMSLSSFGTFHGGGVTVGSGGGDHFGLRAALHPATGMMLLAWTRKDAGGSHAVRMRACDASSTAGLQFLGLETEVSGGSGSEACPALAVNPADKEVAVFWLKGLTSDPTPAFPGDVVGVQYRAAEIWMRRVP